MWRKIHSNRDPRDTLYRELSKEIGPHFVKLKEAGSSMLASYPKCFFWGMVLTMLVSIALAFTIGRHPDKQMRKQVVTGVNPVQNGFEQIMLTAGKIHQTLHLKQLVDSISAKKQLTAADSVVLDSALTQLQRLKKLN